MESSTAESTTLPLVSEFLVEEKRVLWAGRSEENWPIIFLPSFVDVCHRQIDSGRSGKVAKSPCVPVRGAESGCPKLSGGQDRLIATVSTSTSGR